ncbi:MAG TPA: hypothetical protein VIH34_04265 [Candidatus Bathyarchaeia archaeon]
MTGPKPFRFVCPFCLSQMTISIRSLSSEVRGVRRIIQHMKRHQKLFLRAASMISKEIPLVKWRLAKARASLRPTGLRR